MESQPLQQPAAAMTVDFDAVFGNKATPSNSDPQSAAGKAHFVRLSGQNQIDKPFGFAGSTSLAFN